MKDLLINTLSTIRPYVALQGTMDEDEAYPDSFFTYWINDSEDHEDFDDEAFSYEFSFSVIFYTNDPADMYTVPDQTIAALKAVGFIPNGPGWDVASDEPTHTGHAMEFYYIKYL